ncbi:Uncharacterised protein [Haemophilus influenzae]|nr:Uncharacterised protein [Haemophilus influenzae]
MSFDLNNFVEMEVENGLNPFGTGQCLSTLTLLSQ